MSVKEALWQVSPEEYGADYAKDYMAMYNAYVASADAISDKRAKANSFFWTVSVGLLGVTTFFAPEGSNLTFLVAVSGMLLSFGWVRSLESHRTLNAAKFHVIQCMESRLPLAPYTAEWVAYQGGTDKPKHEGLTISEKMVPQVFILLHGIVALIGFVNWVWKIHWPW